MAQTSKCCLFRTGPVTTSWVSLVSTAATCQER